MPTIDKDSDALVIRVVYDGPPEAGKTSSVRALGRSLGCSVETPGEEEGRTTWFDWMEYVGGRFEGRSIRCQVVTVPGQVWFWERRRRLLLEADAVVFVADGHGSRLDGTVQAMEEMRHLLSERDPPPGLVLQANKRDLPDAVPMDELRHRLSDGEPVAITETVATRGDGVRESFVLAVRLALDRVRELMRRDQLDIGRPAVDDAEAMLAALRLPEEAREGSEEERAGVAGGAARSADSGADGDRSGVVLGPVGDGGADPAAADAKVDDAHAGEEPPPPPSPPDPAVEGGLIWPPVGGRVIVHEAVSGEMSLRRLADGAWAEFGNPWWLIHSPRGCRYPDEDRGRGPLVEWARWHTSLESYLSSRRSVVLSPDGRGAWRLWQIVRRGRPLSEALEAARKEGNAAGMVRALAAARAALEHLRERAEIRNLGPGVDTVSFEGERPVLLSLMPPPAASGDRGVERRGDGDRGDGADGGLLRWVRSALASWPGGRETLVAAADSLEPEATAEAVRKLLRRA